jgi:3-oxoacyl-[acyl-carrier-protein] synthase-3
MSIRAVITGTGHGLPSKVLTNFDLEKIVDTNDEWITQRTGIKERRMCAEDETASSISIIAAREALAAAKVDASEIEMVICGTVTGDHPFPSTACFIQAGIGAHNSGAFDVAAACAGFIYATNIATSMIEAGQFKKILVVGVDTLTKFLNWEDRSTCILFGDGAGAIVLEARENTDRGVIKTVLLANGEGARHIIMQKGGSRFPAARDYSCDASPYVFMNGAEVYRFAVNAMGDACCRALEMAGMTADDIDLFVPHQANLRIIKSAAERLGLPDEKVFVNVHKYGNTSGGSIPLGLYEAEKEGRLKEGMVVMTVGFGAGLVWGANLIRW